jgi:hypothetical protein
MLATALRGRAGAPYPANCKESVAQHHLQTEVMRNESRTRHGTGFIGSHPVETLLDSRAEVLVVDDFRLGGGTSCGGKSGFPGLRFQP